MAYTTYVLVQVQRALHELRTSCLHLGIFLFVKELLLRL